MKITRHTDSELTIQDSLLWLSALLLLVSLFPFYDGIRLGQNKNFAVTSMLLLFALLAFRKTTCTFDALRRTAFIRQRKLFTVSERTVPFDQIRDIVLDLDTLGQQRAQYRLALLTPSGSIPLAPSYGPGSQRYSAMRDTILDFLTRTTQLAPCQSQAAAQPAFNPATPDTNSPIVHLLRQGRNIDAITLFRTTHHVSLTEAKRQIDQIADRLKTAN